MPTGSQIIASFILIFTFSVAYTAIKEVFFPEQPRWPGFILCGVVGWFMIDIVRALGF